MNEKELTLVEHLEELRKRLLISLVALFLGMFFSFVFWQETLFNLLTDPLRQLGQELVFLSVTEGFILQIKIALIGGIIIVFPVILWQLIAFILPAFYQNERKVFWSLFLSSLFLFIIGILFAYKVVLGLGLKLFVVSFSGDLTPTISAAKYLTFVLSFLIPFGIVFEIPIATYILTKAGFITPKKLRQNRRYVILIIFILAAILTPPDVISQVLLALPMLFLYEISILISFFVVKR